MRAVWALLLITGCSFTIGRQSTTPEGAPHADCSVAEIATTIDGTVAIGAATLGAVWIRNGNQQTPEQQSEHGDVVTLIGVGVEAIAATFVAAAFYGHAKSSDCEALRRDGTPPPPWFCSMSSSAPGHEARDVCSRQLGVCQELRLATGTECAGSEAAWCFSRGAGDQCAPTGVACAFQREQLLRAAPGSSLGDCAERH